MGLAPYGRAGEIKPLLDIKNGELEIPDWGPSSTALADRGSGSGKYSPSMQHWEDLAWRIQDDTEKVLLARASWLRETTGAKNLVHRRRRGAQLRRQRPPRARGGLRQCLDRPAAGDNGIAIGCAYYGHLAIQKKPRTFVMKQAFLGAPYSDGEVARPPIDGWSPRDVQRAGQNICTETAKVLADGKVFGWFQGRSEFGPRALGNRSILADPRSRR